MQHFSIDLQQDEIRNRAHFQEYFVQDDWRVSIGVTMNAGLRYTLNFPSTEENNQAPCSIWRREQLEYLGRTDSRAARRLHKLNFGPRLGIVGRVDGQDGRARRLWHGVDRDGRASPRRSPRRVFPFLQTVTQRTLDNINPAFVLAQRAERRADPADATAGLGQGVFAVDRDLGSGYVQQWNTSLQRELTPNLASSRLRRIEDHARRHP